LQARRPRGVQVVPSCAVVLSSHVARDERGKLRGAHRTPLHRAPARGERPYAPGAHCLPPCNHHYPPPHRSHGHPHLFRADGVPRIRLAEVPPRLCTHARRRRAGTREAPDRAHPAPAPPSRSAPPGTTVCVLCDFKKSHGVVHGAADVGGRPRAGGRDGRRDRIPGCVPACPGRRARAPHRECR